MRIRQALRLSQLHLPSHRGPMSDSQQVVWTLFMEGGGSRKDRIGTGKRLES